MSTYCFIKSKQTGNVIDIQQASTAAGAPLGSYPEKSSQTDNQLWAFVPDPQNTGYFFIVSKLDGNVIDIQGASDKDSVPLSAYPRNSGDINTLNQLWQFVTDPAGSGYCFIVSKLNGNVIDVGNASTDPGAALVSYPMKSGGTDNQLWQAVGGSFPQTVEPMPNANLGSNHNYILSGDCNNLFNGFVKIEITEDIVCESVGPPPNGLCDGFGTIIGFSFQLNCYSPKYFTSAWQQYLITFWKNASGGYDVRWGVDNWPVTGDNIINNGFPIMATLPTAVLPAGYSITIGWENTVPAFVDPYARGALFKLYDSTGKRIGSINQTLTDFPGVTSSKLAPITAFELNLVGPINGESAVLSSGAGYISYGVAGPNMAPAIAEPGCTESGYVTCETANTFYGPVPPTPNLNFKQSFWVSKTQPMMYRRGRPRPSIRIPQERIDHMLGLKHRL